MHIDYQPLDAQFLIENLIIVRYLLTYNAAVPKEQSI